MRTRERAGADGLESSAVNVGKGVRLQWCRSCRIKASIELWDHYGAASSSMAGLCSIQGKSVFYCRFTAPLSATLGRNKMREKLLMATPHIPDWARFKQFLQTLPYGKVLPTAVYLHRETDACLTGLLAQILTLVARRHAISDDFNVVKFRTDAPRLSFLCY